MESADVQSPIRRHLSRTGSMLNVHEPSPLEQKMQEMKERFQMLRLIDESKQNENESENDVLSPLAPSDEHKSSFSAAPSHISSSGAVVPPLSMPRGNSLLRIDELTKSESERQSAAVALSPQRDPHHTLTESAAEADKTSPRAGSKWSRIRKVVRGESGTALITKRSHTSDGSAENSPRTNFMLSPRSGSTKLESSPRSTQFRQVAARLQSEDMQLQDFWQDTQFFSPWRGFEEIEKHKPTLSLQLTDETMSASARGTDSSAAEVVKMNERDRATAKEKEDEERFAASLEDIAIEISTIPAPRLEEEKDRVQKELLTQHTTRLQRVKEEQRNIIFRENLARERVEEMENLARERLAIEKEKMIRTAQQRERVLGREFRRLRDTLDVAIAQQQAAVKEHFGRVIVANDSLSRRFDVFTNTFPQPIEFRIHLLRGVKNKLHRGAYVMMLTQYDGLGGRPLVWSQSISPTGVSERYPGVTRAVKHRGRFYDHTMRVEDSVFALCPPRPMLRPSFVFVLELFELASHTNPYDRIVAWTAVPMSVESMSLIEGKIKLPLLRGEHNPGIQHFLSMEHLLSQDLSHWLCNVYLEVRHVSLSQLDVTPEMLREAHFDLDYLNKRVSEGDNALIQDVEEGKQGELAVSDVISVKAESSDTPLIAVDKGIFRRKAAVNPSQIERDIESGVNSMQVDASHHSLSRPVDDDNGKTHTPHNSLAHRVLSFFAVTPTPRAKSVKRIQLGNASLRRQPSLMPDSAKDTEVRERGYNLQDKVFLHEQQQGKLLAVESVDTPHSRQWARAGLEGKIVRRWQSEGPRFDTEAIESGDPLPTSPLNTPHVAKQQQSFQNSTDVEKGACDYHVWEELRDEREMCEYTMSLSSDVASKKRLTPSQQTRSKLRYISVELWGDLVPYLYGTFDFYMTLSVFLFALWIRIYVHYLAQYLYILSQSTPIYGFKLYLLFMSFRYASQPLTTAVEVGVVAMGPVACVCVFAACVACGHAFYKWTGFLPDIFSRFFAFFGVATALDPLLTLLIDLVYHHYDCGSVSAVCRADYTSSHCDCYVGDAMKLWQRMLRVEGSGISGAFITTLLYLGCMTLSLLLLYVYLVYVHRDARILDMWRRVQAPHSEFFLPEDWELSAEELKDVLAKARTFRSLTGSRRKVVVERVLHKPQQSNEEKAGLAARGGQGEGLGGQRVAIMEVDAAGRELSVFRQFFVDDGGAIVELFQRGTQKKKKDGIFRVKTDDEDARDENEREGEEDEDEPVGAESESDNEDAAKREKEKEKEKERESVRKKEQERERDKDERSAARRGSASVDASLAAAHTHTERRGSGGSVLSAHRKVSPEPVPEAAIPTQ